MSRRKKKKQQREKKTEKTHQLHSHHQQQRRRDQRRPKDAALVVKVVCPLRTGRRGARGREEKIAPLARRERVEPLPSADEGEAEGQDDALDRLIMTRGYSDEEERGV